MSKSLFIRCSQETYELAHALAKKESRSLNKQIIHMIHSVADEKDVAVNKLLQESREAVGLKEDTPKQEHEETHLSGITGETVSIEKGLSRLAETKRQDFQD